MFCLVLHSGILCSCRMSIQSWYFCVQDEEKLWFLMCLRQESMLCHFCLFFKNSVLGVFNNPVATPAYGLLGLGPNFRLRFLSENASLLALYVCSTTHGPNGPSHFTKLLTRALFFTWPLFLYFRFMSGLSRSCCRWPE